MKSLSWRLNVRLQDDDARRLQELSDRECVPVASLIRLAIRRELDRSEKRGTKERAAG